jgi:hypothetical protein
LCSRKGDRASKYASAFAAFGFGNLRAISPAMRLISASQVISTAGDAEVLRLLFGGPLSWIV